jgi:hypothetical protein
MEEAYYAERVGKSLVKNVDLELELDFFYLLDGESRMVMEQVQELDLHEP